MMNHIRTRAPFRLKRSIRILAASGLALGALMSAHGQTVAVNTPRRAEQAALDARWQSTFEEFEASDQARAPRPGGVVFVGSSSIRLWNDLETSFGSKPQIIKRGFGGSRLSDCSANLQRLVLAYKPRLVVVYAGDNDLAEGATPAEVLGSFQTLVQGVRAELPETRIAFVSIKPSPSREKLMPAARATNMLIEAYAGSESNVDYVDVWTKMLGLDGRPRAELYGKDLLHLNPAGYALWTREISARLKL